MNLSGPAVPARISAIPQVRESVMLALPQALNWVVLIETRVVVQDRDGKWGWAPKADNGQIIATDGSQGYEKEAAARKMGYRIIDGEFKDAEKKRRECKKPA